MQCSNVKYVVVVIREFDRDQWCQNGNACLMLNFCSLNNCFQLLHLRRWFDIILMQNKVVYKMIHKLTNKGVTNGSCSSSSVKNIVHAIAVILLTALCLERASQSVHQYLEESTFLRLSACHNSMLNFPHFQSALISMGTKRMCWR